MNTAQLFTRAVMSLPEAVKERLDDHAPLDWGLLEDAATALEVDVSARAHRRLPEAVEILAARLVAEVGVVPADLVSGVEREGAARAWLRHVSVEPDGESYRVHNRLNGDVHFGIRPEAVAGYVMLALFLATAVYEAGERWIEAAGRYRSAVDDEIGPLARCAVLIGERLGSPSESGARRRSTWSLAALLEDAWNSQDFAVRAELSTAIRVSTARGASAPRRRCFAPMNGYRMHSCDLGEVHWLRALAERARAGAPSVGREAASQAMNLETGNSAAAENGDRAASEEADGPASWIQSGMEASLAVESDSDPDEIALGRELAELQGAVHHLPAALAESPVEDVVAEAGPNAGAEAASLDMAALEMQIRSETANAFEFASDPGELAPDDVLSDLRRAVNRLPVAVRRRLGASYGVGVSQALTRLRDTWQADSVNAELRAAASGPRAPQWLEELASALLADTGAQTRNGRRTGRLRLDPAEGPEGGYLATELEVGVSGHLTVLGLLEQLHLGLIFARDVWNGLATLRNAGKEGGWALGGGVEFADSERETLEAARQIEQALGGAGDRNADPRRAPSALEQASTVANAVASLGPTVRAAAGWPGAAEAPDPRNPEDIARLAGFAEALHEVVKSISNRLIAGRFAEPRSHGATPDA